MFKYVDYTDVYGRIMQFNKNKLEPFHRWYPFVEGYSKEFIQSIIAEMNGVDLVCLEPFSGSGTTSLELQNIGMKCYSFEVNPFMYLVAKVKLEKKYNYEILRTYHERIINTRKNYIVTDLNSVFKTLYQSEDKLKWNYNNEVAIAVAKLKQAINDIDNVEYRQLFTVALASILLDVSNLYRNGKCLSYKKNWNTRKIIESEVFDKFDSKVNSEILPDIMNMFQTRVSNQDYIYLEDSRIGIAKRIADDSIDLVITSPPYLNSRDYTDTYMLELRTLDFTSNPDEVRSLRDKTLRSHVQIKWKDPTSLNNKLLEDTLHELNESSKNVEVWNDSIMDMIRLYFVDMDIIFNNMFMKLKNGGKVYFNVSNSAYFNVHINTLEICSLIAHNQGFKVLEIRKARYIKTSPQQQATIGKLLEGVIVLQKP